MISPTTSSPPGPRSPLNATVSDDTPDPDFSTLHASNGTTGPIKFDILNSEDGQYRYAYITEKTSMVQADRADTEDLDNYFVCELPASMNIQDTYMPWSDAYQIDSRYTVWAVGPNATFEATVFFEDAWVNSTGDDIANLVCRCVGYSHHINQ